ncbi:MAG: hypothetical protein ACI9K9_001991 [Neolewinella sp.]
MGGLNLASSFFGSVFVGGCVHSLVLFFGGLPFF